MNEKPIVIAVLAGTIRSSRESIKAAQYVASIGRRYDNVEIVLVDPQSLQLPDEGEVVKDPAYSDITARADAFFIVTPEYNHSFPGTLKRMLDSEYNNYFHKPVAVAGVSSGPWGGVRVCEALLPVLHRIGMVIIRPEVYFPHIKELFDEGGVLGVEHQARYEKNVRASYDELIWFVRALRSQN